MLNYFLAGIIYLATLDIEVMRTILRVDRVYKVLYKGIEHILHLEFETGSDPEMEVRLLDYHAYLHRKYHLPVISIIVYPFETKMAQSPWNEMSGEDIILTFHFQVFPLWKLSAAQFVREHAVVMYPLLPIMGDANGRCQHSVAQPSH